MAFGQEVKDFLGAFSGVRKLKHEDAQDKYYQARSDWYERRSGGANGPTFDYDGALKQEEGSDGSLDSNAPHGMLYNLGKWLGLNGEDNKTAPAAIPASPAAAVQSTTALPMDAYEASMNPQTDGYQGGYSRGGVVRAFAQGGAVPAPTARPDVGQLTAADNPDVYNDGGPEADAAAPDDGKPEVYTPPNNSPVETRELPPAQQQQAVPTGAVAAADHPETDGATPDFSADSKSLASALHGGIMALTQNFNLAPNASAVPDQQQMAANQKQLMDGAGRAPADQMRQLAKAVDPKGELTHSQMVLRAMTKGYEFYMEHGDPQKANNYAAMIIQYSTFEASKHGADALDALQKGDIHGAAKALQAGYANIPDGKEATDVKVNPDKTVSVTETDVATGKPVAKHTLTGQQLYQAAIGLKNKSQSWQAIMTAAAGAKNVNLPQSDAYAAAQAKLSGANADGTLTDEGNPQAPGAEAIPTQPQGQTQQAAAPVDGKAPLGIRTNNPGNLRPNGQQANYDNPTAGVLAASANLDSYAKQGVNTISAIISKWAPSNDNDTANYIKFVAQRMGVDPNQPLALQDPNVKGKLLEAMFQMENGQQPRLQSAVYTSNAPAQQSTPARPAAQAPQGGQGNQGGPLALKPALPEDQAPDQPVAPQMGQLPAQPKTPHQVSIADFDTSTMSPSERAALTKQIIQTNQANRTKFNEDMRLYNADAQRVRSEYSAAHQKYADEVKANKAGKDKYSLPVKDRGNAITAIQTAHSEFEQDPSFASLSPKGQGAVKDVAYGLYTHNDTTPDAAVKVAAAMLNPGVSMKNGKLNISTPFSVHETADPGTVRIVYGQQKLLMPKNAFDQLAAARGNEIFIARKKLEAGEKDAQDKQGIVDSGVKLAKGLGKSAKDVVGKVAGAADNAVGEFLTDPGKAISDSSRNLGRGALAALDVGVLSPSNRR